MTRWSMLVFVLAGCRQLFGFEEPIVTTDGGGACTSNTQCSPDLPVCDTTAGICVECTENQPGACLGETPVCGADERCRACVVHADCTSTACLPTGACADADNVAYAQPEGRAGSGCQQDSPCATVEEAVAVGQPIIKLAGQFDAAAQIVLVKSVVVLAEPGTRIARITVGSVMRIQGGDVELYDLEVTGALGGSNGIDVTGANTSATLVRCILRGHSGAGLIADAAAAVTVRSSTILQNAGGGVRITGAVVTMTNNLVVFNGSGGTNSGGLVLDPLSGSVIQFNTIANNVSSSSLTDGVACISPFAAPNNIVTGNSLGAQCTFDHLLFDDNTVPPMGEGNINGAPDFVLTDPDSFRDAGFFRIGPQSDAIDNADPDATLADDIDGDPRPQGRARDIGADELAP